VMRAGINVRKMTSRFRDEKDVRKRSASLSAAAIKYRPTGKIDPDDITRCQYKPTISTGVLLLRCSGTRRILDSARRAARAKIMCRACRPLAEDSEKIQKKKKKRRARLDPGSLGMTFSNFPICGNSSVVGGQWGALSVFLYRYITSAPANEVVGSNFVCYSITLTLGTRLPSAAGDQKMHDTVVIANLRADRRPRPCGQAWGGDALEG